MNVRELIEALQAMPQDLAVYVNSAPDEYCSAPAARLTVERSPEGEGLGPVPQVLVIAAKE